MALANIRFLYRLLINQGSANAWDKAVFESTYAEFKMQQQLFNSKENPAATFKELLELAEKAEQLHYLVGIAALNYIRQWNGKVYRVMDNSCKEYLPFSEYRLDIVDSHISDKNKHEVAISFFSPQLLLLNAFGDHLVVASKPEEESTNSNRFITQTFKLQPMLSVCYYEPLNSHYRNPENTYML